jgi:hypothetical protein
MDTLYDYLGVGGTKTADQPQRDLEAHLKERLLTNGPKSGKAQAATRKESLDYAKQFRQSSPYKRTNLLTSSYKKLKNGVLTAGKGQTGAADMSIIFSYMKMLDPGSAVKEGEYATAANTANIPDKVRNYYNAAIKGDKLGDAQREEFLQQATGIMNASIQTKNEERGRMADEATRFGLDANLSFGNNHKEAPKLKKHKGEWYEKVPGGWRPAK